MIVKSVIATAGLTQRMVKDAVAAGTFPLSALSLMCGSSAGVMNALQTFDVMPFTGGTTRLGLSVPGRPSRNAVRASILRPTTSTRRCCCLTPRPITMPLNCWRKKWGALVNKAQLASVRAGLGELNQQTKTLHDGTTHPSLNADLAVARRVSPTLLGTHNPENNGGVHDTEVFGPIATLRPYRNPAHALAIMRRGRGSLVALFDGSDPQTLVATSLQPANSHDRVHVISPDVAQLHTAHCKVRPQSLHGGPGRAGGGEELGGLRALGFYHRRSAVQASTVVLAALSA